MGIPWVVGTLKPNHMQKEFVWTFCTSRWWECRNFWCKCLYSSASPIACFIACTRATSWNFNYFYSFILQGSGHDWQVGHHVDPPVRVLPLILRQSGFRLWLWRLWLVLHPVLHSLTFLNYKVFFIAIGSIFSYMVSVLLIVLWFASILGNTTMFQNISSIAFLAFYNYIDDKIYTASPKQQM